MPSNSHAQRPMGGVPAFPFTAIGAAAAWIGRGTAFVARRWGVKILICTVPLGIVATNAMMQKGPHPAPFFGATVRPALMEDRTEAISKPLAVGGNTGTEARNDAGNAARAALVSEIQKELANRGFYIGNADGVHGPRTDTAIRDFEQASGRKWNGAVDDALLQRIVSSTVKAPAAKTAAAAPRSRPDPIGELIAPSQRVIAVQRALTDFGYGPVRATGVFNTETKLAIEKFERERKLPISGQVSDRLLRELGAVTGRPLE